MQFTEKNADVVSALAIRIQKIMKKDGNKKQILRMKTPWDLYRLGLRTSDIQPSYAEAILALRKAQGK